MVESEADGNERFPEAPNVLLSIHPEFADAILDGEKRWEYRKVAPTRGPPYRIVLYATAPVKAAVGVAWSYSALMNRPVATLIEETVGYTPHSREDLLDYFGDAETGSALRIGTYRRFDEPIPRETLEEAGFEPGQNFRYIGTVPSDETRVEPALISPVDDEKVRSLLAESEQ